MEIGGTTAGFDHDQLVASGIQFGGDLEILLVDGFIPSGGDEFDLFESVSSSGNFTSIQLPAGIDWDTSSLLTAGILSVANPFVLDGDYNGTGIVNIFDLNLALFDWDQDGAEFEHLVDSTAPRPRGDSWVGTVERGPVQLGRHGAVDGCDTRADQRLAFTGFR